LVLSFEAHPSCIQYVQSSFEYAICTVILRLYNMYKNIFFTLRKKREYFPSSSWLWVTFYAHTPFLNWCSL
jgi:hypothetical protein